MMITQERLKELVTYDPETGIFRWKIKHGSKVCIGQIAGSIKLRGHIIIRLDYQDYRAHRLAWLYMTGNWPKDQLDHIDYNSGNNIFSNLREATNSQNHMNKPRQPNNTSGFKGVTIDKRRDTWRATIKKKGKVTFLGSFPTPEIAYAAYVRAANEIFGKFARLL